jgi:hypothetical protein
MEKKPKYQGFAPLGVLFGFFVLVLSAVTGWLFQLNRGAMYFTIVGWSIVLVIIYYWMQGRE